MAKILDLVTEVLSTAGDPALRRGQRDFSRDGTLTPDLLVVLLLFMAGDANRRGYRHILDDFWDECGSHSIPLPSEKPVSAAAFCQARSKLSTKLLRHILHEASARMERTFRKLSRWHGRRVFAVDGCKMNLQRSDELDARFGRPEGGHVPQATVSVLLNVSSRVPYDLAIGPYGACERQLLLDHLGVLKPGDVLVLDRGYPSHQVLRILSHAGIDFVVRVPKKGFQAIEVFRQSGGDDYRVVLEAPGDGSCGAEPFELRAIKVTNPKGEESFFLTSLRRSQFSCTELSELYQLRWQAEEFYKLEKSSYFDQSQFHARSAFGVEQEILAQAIYVVVTRFLLAAAAEHVDAPYHDLSVKSAVLALAAHLARLCLDDPDRALRSLPGLLDRIARTRDKRRPGRSCPPAGHSSPARAGTPTAAVEVNGIARRPGCSQK